MAVITPNSVTLNPNGTQTFTSDLPVLTLEGVGTLVSGLYTAPATAGSAKVRAHTSFWLDAQPTYFTKNADDSVTRNATAPGYYSYLTANHYIQNVGDWFSFVAPQANPWIAGLQNGAETYQFLYVGASGWIRERHPSNGGDITTVKSIAAGQTVKDEILSDGKIKKTCYAADGSVVWAHTSVQSFTGRSMRWVMSPAAMSAGETLQCPKMAATGYEEISATVVIDYDVAAIVAADPLYQYPPKSNLVAWHAADKAISGSTLTLLDLSKNSRHLQSSTNLPTIGAISGKLNGKPAVYSNGSKDPLKYTGAMTAKHVFVVAAAEDAAFSTLRGLISGLSNSGAEAILVSEGSGTKFYDNDYENFGAYAYKKSDVAFAENAQAAPMSGNFAILEVQIPFGLSLTGLQILQDRAYIDRKWKGWWVEHVIGSQIWNYQQRMMWYRYFALKYNLWRLDANGNNIFPFPFNRASQFESEDLAEISEAEGLRGRDKVVRYLDDAPIASYNFTFEKRKTNELQTVLTFLNQHRLHVPFTIDDCERSWQKTITRTSKLTDVSDGANLHSYGFSGREY